VVGTKIVAKFASEGFILIQPNNVPLATLQVFVSNAHSMVYAFVRFGNEWMPTFGKTFRWCIAEE